MKTSIVGTLVGAAAVAAIPAIALASNVLVDHGNGPTAVHDPALGDVNTQVHAWADADGTELRLMVRGLPANRTFGAHVHTAPCGDTPGASGGHYQHSTDATVPLAAREVWLDFTTDEKGKGTGTTHVPWHIAAGTAGSVVIHADPTNPTTGVAGARLVCTTVPFGQ